MEKRLTLHIVDPSSRNRAEISRMAFALGHHAEVYADIAELARHLPRDGIIIARDRAGEGGISAILEQLSMSGVWLPVIGTDDEHSVERVVAAIKAGALEYLPLPLDHEQLGATLIRIADEAVRQADTRYRMMDARSRIDDLSGREREVLDWLTEGSSNKDIARALEISPRTVEIHRSNMMTKLGAKHAAQAVRLRLEAQIGNPLLV